MDHYYEEGSAFYRVLESRQAGCAVVIGAIIRGRGLPTTLLPLVTPADEQSSNCNGVDQAASEGRSAWKISFLLSDVFSFFCFRFLFSIFWYLGNSRSYPISGVLHSLRVIYNKRYRFTFRNLHLEILLCLVTCPTSDVWVGCINIINDFWSP